MGTLTLITGGARSGKSAWALARANALPANLKLFIATAQALDTEMRERIQRHQQERSSEWQTIEEPHDLPDVITGLQSDCVAVIDCVTVWLGNVWHTAGTDNTTLMRYIDSLCSALETWQQQSSGTLFVVSNEVGWGIVPVDAGVRRYRDMAGLLNRRIASIAHEVYLCVAGIAVPIKQQGEKNP